jgi:glucan biosynthesis protein C
MNIPTTPSRRYDLDWLRVLGVLAVFFFHSLHFFDTGDWAIKNATTYPWIDSLMALLGM